jgi:hypothetical protein
MPCSVIVCIGPLLAEEANVAKIHPFCPSVLYRTAAVARRLCGVYWCNSSQNTGIPLYTAATLFHPLASQSRTLSEHSSVSMWECQRIIIPKSSTFA